jgi:hypothetical protein
VALVAPKSFGKLIAIQSRPATLVSCDLHGLALQFAREDKVAWSGAKAENKAKQTFAQTNDSGTGIANRWPFHRGEDDMDLMPWILILFLIGLVTFGLLFAFVVGCAKV